MASKGVSTAGSKVGWAKGTDDKTVPKSFTKIPEVKEVPELNPEPATLETTTLEETEYKTYTSGLKDLGGAIALTCNFTEEMKTSWSAMCTAANGGSVWICIQHPTIGAVAFLAQPNQLGMPQLSVDNVLEVSAYLVPTSAPQWIAESVTIADA